MPKLVKATDAERRAYKGVYPLSHFVTVDGQRLPVEYLGGAMTPEASRPILMQVDDLVSGLVAAGNGGGLVGTAVRS